MPDVSCIIVSHNRRGRLLATLDRLRDDTSFPPGGHDVWVVDNASDDGTADAVRRLHPAVHLVALPTNEGVGARTHAMLRAPGRYQALLDDDSYPVGDTLPRAAAYLDAQPDVGAVGGACQLPDGRAEACALPGVLISCAVLVRASAARAVGGFRPEFFRKGGEYDFSFRLWNAGHRVERFEDLVWRHDKVLSGRSAAFAHRMDLRNNLLLAERFVPRPHRSAFRRDWLRRYARLAAAAGHAAAAAVAVTEARTLAADERTRGRQPLTPAALEAVFGFEAQAAAVAGWATTHGIQRVLLADLGKNIHVTHAACRRAGLAPIAVLDAGSAFAGGRYRGLPVVADLAAAGHFDGVVLTNVNPAQVGPRTDTLRTATDRPVLTLWRPRRLDEHAPALRPGVLASLQPAARHRARHHVRKTPA